MGLTTKRSSHHLLPLSSMIFKSKSQQHLQDTAQASVNVGPSTTTTLPNIGEALDNNLTALPATAKSSSFPKFKLDKKKKSASLASPIPESPSQVAILGTQEEAEEKDKKALWRRWFGGLKTMFKSKKDKTAKKPEDRTPTPPPFSIGSPTDFKHVLTGSPVATGGPGGPQYVPHGFGGGATQGSAVQGAKVEKSPTWATEFEDTN